MRDSLFPEKLDRRRFLRGLGVGLALPTLESFGGFRALAADGSESGIQRLIAIETNQGILPQNFFPQGEGFNYVASPYLKLLDPFREQMTFFTGVSHPSVDGGHSAEKCFLTAAPGPGRGGFRNSISVDQYAADRIGHRTRFPSLSLAVGTRESLSYTQSGVQIPGESSPSRLFRSLFLTGSETEVSSQVERLRRGQSILDSVGDRAKSLSRNASAGDRDKLDQFFTGVRELETRLHKSEEWAEAPKPEAPIEMPKDEKDPGALIERTRLMYQLARLALETDSTRLISIYLKQNTEKANISGVLEGTHPLTHHGNRPDKLSQLQLIEAAQFAEVADLLGDLRATET
ncbi:MAG: DUF1552 domain-containing protein, partial [Verrucomicrobiota bacterium]